MVGHGHPLDPELELSSIDNYNLIHFTYRQDCPVAIYTEIVRRLRQNPLAAYNEEPGDMFRSLIFAPADRLPEEMRTEIVQLFYDVEFLADELTLWKTQKPWLPYVEH